MALVISVQAVEIWLPARGHGLRIAVWIHPAGESPELFGQQAGCGPRSSGDLQ